MPSAAPGPPSGRRPACRILGSVPSPPRPPRYSPPGLVPSGSTAGDIQHLAGSPWPRSLRQPHRAPDHHPAPARAHPHTTPGLAATLWFFNGRSTDATTVANGGAELPQIMLPPPSPARRPASPPRRSSSRAHPARHRGRQPGPGGERARPAYFDRRQKSPALNITLRSRRRPPLDALYPPFGARCAAQVTGADWVPIW